MGSQQENEEILYSWLLDAIYDDDFIVEFGCGKGVRLEWIRNNLVNQAMGIEIFKPYYEEALSKGLCVFPFDIRHVVDTIELVENHFKNDRALQNLKLPIIPQCYLFIDVLEHLTDDNALHCIKKLQSLDSTRCICVFVPNGHCPQEEYDDNMYQKHLSTWHPLKLQDLGFTTEVFDNFHEGLPEGWSTSVILATWKRNNE